MTCHKDTKSRNVAHLLCVTAFQIKFNRALNLYIHKFPSQIVGYERSTLKRVYPMLMSSFIISKDFMVNFAF